MTAPMKLVVNCETGEQTMVDMTEEELAVVLASQAEAAEQAAILEAEIAAKENAKTTAVSKLEALGFTAEEVTALLS